MPTPIMASLHTGYIRARSHRSKIPASRASALQIPYMPTLSFCGASSCTIVTVLSYTTLLDYLWSFLFAKMATCHIGSSNTLTVFNKAIVPSVLPALIPQQGLRIPLRMEVRHRENRLGFGRLRRSDHHFGKSTGRGPCFAVSVIVTVRKASLQALAVHYHEAATLCSV